MAKKVIIILVVLVLGTLAAIWKLHSKEPLAIHQENSAEACLNNLRLIQSAKMQWSLEDHKIASEAPTWDDLRPFIGRGSNGIMPECPMHGVYMPGTVGEEPSCSIHGTLPDPK